MKVRFNYLMPLIVFLNFLSTPVVRATDLETEVAATLMVYICFWRNGHIATAEEAADEAFDALKDKGYTGEQIYNLIRRTTPIWKKGSTPEICAMMERKSRQRLR